MKKVIAIILALVIMVPIVISNIKAAERTITSFNDFNLGKFSGTESQTNKGSLKLADSSSWVGRAWETPNLTLGDQAAIGTDGNQMYLLPNGSTEMMRFLPLENKWESLARAPKMAYAGAGMTYLEGYFYVIFGNNQKEFARYSPNTNSWQELTMLPDLVSSGAQIVNDGNNVYILRGGGTSDFWKYNPDSNSWTTMSTPPATIAAGSGLVYKDGAMYALRGGTTNTFYKYTITSDLWTTLPNAPNTFAEDHIITIRGSEIFATRNGSTNSFYKYNIGTTTWSTIANTPQITRFVGSIYIPADDKVYVFRGNTTYDFWKYDAVNNVFLGIPDLPNTTGTGSDLVAWNNELYFLRGAASQSFYKLSLGATGLGATWVTLQNIPGAVNDDIKMTVAGNNIFAYVGGGSRNFYKYDLSVGVGATWTTMAMAPATISYGASLIYPGSGSYLYGTRGGFSRSFYRYTIGVGETWDDAVVADLPDNAEVGYGSRMATNGTDIFLLTGSTIAKLYKYTIGSNTWTDMGNLPFAPFYGTDIAYYSGKLYIQSGYYKPDVWEYTISGGGWRRINNLMTAYATRLGPYNGASLEVDANGNLYSFAGAGLSWIQKYTISANKYVATGSYESEVMDLNKVSSFSSLSVSSTTPGDSQIIVNTRTSSDRINWSNWALVSGGSIASPTNRYLQIGVTMTSTSDRSQTPEISEIKVNYIDSQDTPVAPTTFGGMSQSVSGVGLTSGNSYPYISPYFNWSGASDGDGIKGYYVYFGSSNSADPETEGNYQINSTYLVTTPMSTGTYYLRVRSVDEFDNVSAAVTGFVYQYNGISPPTELVINSNDDFGVGTTSNLTIDSGLMKLKAKAGFFKDERLTMTPQLVYNGADMDYVASSGKLYVIFGNNLNRFYEYNVALDLWSTLANAPAGFNAGAGIVAGPTGYLYAARGNNTKNFWRYEISTNTWSDTAAAETPQEMYYGGSLVYDGSRYIYALKGNADDTFMRYDTQEDSWVTLANVDFGQPEFQPNNVVGYGGDLAMDRDNDLVYAIQGNLRGGFGYYDIEDQSWNRLGNLPALAYYGARIELDSANGYMYYFSGWDKPYWYKYDIDEQTWTEMPEVPTPVGYGGTVSLINNKLYLLRGANTNLFYKYDLNKNTWFVPTVGLFGTWYRGTNSRNYGTGADIVKGDGENYYILRGNYDNTLARYNSTTGEMESLADAPAGFYDGTEMTYDSVRNKLFVTGSNYFNRLFSYDIASNSWSEAVGSSMPTDSGAGTAIAFDGANSIYRLRGATTTTFDKYNILTGLWSTLPATLGAVGYGGDMVIRNDYAYVVRGNGTTSFYRFGPLSVGGTWSDTAVNDLPSGQTIGQDGFLVDVGNNNLVACRGTVTNACFLYSITNNSWSTMPSAPANISAGGAGASNGSNEMLYIAGSGGTNTYNMGVHKYVVSSSNSSVEESGSWISPSYDLGSIYRWSGLEVIYNQATNNSIKVYTRTSDDNNDWDEWVETNDYKKIGSSYSYKIGSEKRRYIQIKTVMMSGDGIFSGSIDQIKLSYYTDEIPPVNPTINGYLSIGGTELVSGNWGNSTAPYFSWSGAGDTGAGVAGYYVYFGIGATAAPETLGTFTTGTAIIGSGLTLGQTYYFRMKTVDDAGNTSSEVGTTYVYKFDNKAPINPLAVLADPPGYTTNTTYKFTWDVGSDDDSGIKEYCYKTGAGEGEWASDQCVMGAGITGVTGVPKYKSDENIFYLRVKDMAGNTAVSYQTAVYKHSGSAPSAPRNVRVSYPTDSNQNTENDFGFAWDTPESYLGNPSNMVYYYSINEEPTPSNVTRVGTDVRFLSRGQYATRKGVNTLYVVVSDEAGNIKVTNGKYDNYGSVDFEAVTSAPGVPRNIDISDVSIKETASWRLALSWDAPEASGSGIANYKVYRSTTGTNCSSSMEDFSLVNPSTSKSYVDSGLDQVKYYYCVKSCDSTNECSAPSETVYFLPDGRWRVAPTLAAEPDVVVKTKTAIVSWSTSRKANSFVKYGKSSGNYGDEVGNSDQVSAHTISLTGLDPGTTYYYQASWTDEDGNTGSSSEYSFTTNPAPFVSAVKVSDIGLYSAYINFKLANATKARVEYGTTTAYGGVNELTTSTAESTYMVKVENLDEGTVYQIRISAEDEEGNMFRSDNYEFETLPVPKIEGEKIQQVKGAATATVRVVWKSNTGVSSIISYYPKNSPEKVKDSIQLTLTKTHQMIINGLNDDTDYVFVIKGKDVGGNEAKSAIVNFKTSNDLRPPLINQLKVESMVTGVGDQAKAQIVINWKTDEPATGQSEYGEGTGSDYPYKTQENNALVSDHVINIPDLKPGTVYHVRVVTKDGVGNKAESFDSVVVTPKATKSALDLVIGSLSKSFGFFNGLGNIVSSP